MSRRRNSLVTTAHSVRRGTGSAVRLRRAMVVLVSAGGTPFP